LILAQFPRRNAIVDHVDEFLSRASDILVQRGVVAIMTELIGDVYVKNATRHDPVLGDDPTTFGFTTSRNIANRSVRRLEGLPGVRARLVDTALEVTCDGHAASVQATGHDTRRERGRHIVGGQRGQA
jgi:hypothetical protein